MSSCLCQGGIRCVCYANVTCVCPQPALQWVLWGRQWSDGGAVPQDQRISQCILGLGRRGWRPVEQVCKCACIWAHVFCTCVLKVCVWEREVYVWSIYSLSCRCVSCVRCDLFELMSWCNMSSPLSQSALRRLQCDETWGRAWQIQVHSTPSSRGGAVLGKVGTHTHTPPACSCTPTPFPRHQQVGCVDTCICVHTHTHTHQHGRPDVLLACSSVHPRQAHMYVCVSEGGKYGFVIRSSVQFTPEGTNHFFVCRFLYMPFAVHTCVCKCVWLCDLRLPFCTWCESAWERACRHCYECKWDLHFTYNLSLSFS